MTSFGVLIMRSMYGVMKMPRIVKTIERKNVITSVVLTVRLTFSSAFAP